MSRNNLEEFSLIEQLVRAPSHFKQYNILGPGDDCAALPIPGEPFKKLLITTDSLVESIHFSPSYCSWSDIGWKSLAVSLSDIAAMGGHAEYCVVSLQIRDTLSSEDLQEIYQGLYQLADYHQVHIVGGDTVSAKQLSITTTVLGTCSGEPFLRSGAKAGDDIWVSGFIGSAAAGLAIFQGEIEPSEISMADACRESHLKPEPRLELSKSLRELGSVSSMIDVSDGIFQDASHIAQNSACSLEIELEAVPNVFEDNLGLSSKCAFLAGGDDYELLFTAPRDARDKLESSSLNLSRIGSVVSTIASDKHSVYVKSEGNKKVTYDYFLGQLGISSGYRHLINS